MSVRQLPIIPISTPRIGAVGKTGKWRIFKPIIKQDKCVKCLQCWLYCPDAAIIRDENDNVTVNYDYCKGCGICAHECPVKAIEMVKEE